MTEHIFIGVDGGATKSVVRIEDQLGVLLGKETSGPASIRNSVPQTWQSINTALAHMLKPLNISLNDPRYQFHVGMGLAGCELADAKQAFLQAKHQFQTLIVTSDAHTACLGAHNGADGSIIIVGTGVVGYQIENGHITKVSGWGFPHDDDGGGAWLGMQAVKVTLKWLDGRLPASSLAHAVYAFFKEDRDSLVRWANQANSTHFAELAPLLIQAANAQDEIAYAIMQAAGFTIDDIGNALFTSQQNKKSILPCALMGGIAASVEPYLGEVLRNRLCASHATPDQGAMLMVREHFKQQGHH